MKAWIMAAVAVAGCGLAGTGWAQGNVVAERRAGLREMGSHMEAIAAIVQSRGDQRQIAARVDQMVPFFQSLPARVPAATLTPPLPQGRQDGQTNALAAIEANRADFGQRAANMVTALTALKTAAEAGTVGPDLLRGTSATCIACHQQYRAR